MQDAKYELIDQFASILLFTPSWDGNLSHL